VYNGTEFCSCL